jgi:hypothetical protein
MPTKAVDNGVLSRGIGLSGCWYAGITSAFAATYTPFIIHTFGSTIAGLTFTIGHFNHDW